MGRRALLQLAWKEGRYELCRQSENSGKMDERILKSVFVNAMVLVGNRAEVF
jgi:hypothetical protein